MRKYILSLIVLFIITLVMISCAKKSPSSPLPDVNPATPTIIHSPTATITPGGPTLTVTETPPVIPGSLADALDNNSVTWETGGNADWFFQTTYSNDGFDAARSGPIDNGEFTYLQADVTGPFVLSFYWMIESELVFNAVTFFIDDVVQVDGVFSGFQPWWLYKEYFVPAGSHTIKWVYDKTIVEGLQQDCAWIDEVVFSALTNTPVETITPTETHTHTDTETFTVTNTFTESSTMTSTFTATYTYTAIDTSTAIDTPTKTNTITDTFTRTKTPTGTEDAGNAQFS